MKKKEIMSALNALKQIKMPQIEDKELRNDIISNHLLLLDAMKKYDGDIAKLEKVYLSSDSAKKDREEVTALQEKAQVAKTLEERNDLIRQIQSHTEWAKTVQLYNEAVNKLADEDVNGIKVIDRERFINAILPSMDYSLGLLECVYPMLSSQPEAEK